MGENIILLQNSIKNMDYSQVFSVITILNGITFFIIMGLMGKMQMSLAKIEPENNRGQEFKLGNLIMAFFIWQLVQLFFTNFNWNYDLLQGSIDIIISQNLGIAKKIFDFIFTVIISVIFYKLAGQLLENNDGIILMIFLRFFIWWILSWSYNLITF